MATGTKQRLNADEFVKLYTQHEQKLYRYVAAMLAHPDEVEDVLQDTAMLLWQRFAEYRRDEPFLPWACAVARYKVFNHCQRVRTQRKYFRSATLELLAETRLERNDLLEAQTRWMRKCVNKLAPPDRQLVEDRYASEQTLTQLADETGRTPNSLYKSLQRIRRVLLVCVDEGLKSEGWK